MPWGIDDVNLVIFPKASHRCRGNGDTALFLLGHPVSGGTITLATHLTDLVRQAGPIQNTFGCGGLPCVNMGNNTDISKVF